MKNKIFLTVVKENLSYTVLAAIFQILFALSVTLVSYSLSIMFKAYSLDQKKFFNSIIFVGVLMLTATLLSFLSDYVKAKYIMKTNESLRLKMTKSTSENSYDLILKRNTGKAISWFINDASQIETQAFSNFLDFIFYIALVISAFTYIMILHWSLAIVSILFLIISLFIPRLTQKYMMQSQKEYTNANENYTESIRDNIEGLSVFFIGNALPMFQIKMKDAIKLRENHLFNFSITQAKIGSIMLFVSLLSQIGLVGFSLYISSLGLTATGSVLSIAGLSGNLFNGVQSLTGTIATFKAAEVLLEKFQNIKENTTHKENIASITKITINNVKICYSENVIFNNFSYEFIKGKKYAIVGASGSGKSTLLKMIMGLSYPEEGNVKINNLDIDMLNLNLYYQHIAYIEQSIYLINGTIRENITLGSDISEEKLSEVLKKVHLQSFIQKQPQGLNTLIESNGQGISGGEKQRIALARALIKDVDFILIDESTSQLDKVTREAIEKTILNFQNLGIIYVSHNTNNKILGEFDETIDSRSFK